MALKNFFSTVSDKIHHRNTAVFILHGNQAAFHWRIAVITFFIGVFTIFISSLLIYRDISQGDFFPVDNKIGGSSAPVTAELIGEVVSDFKTKSDKFNQLISNRSISVDPSR